MFDSATSFHVVVNNEGQYSIWPDSQDYPAGWEPVGKTGSKEECLASIEQIWTDMRPASLRQQVDND
jgi:MbtH protein